MADVKDDIKSFELSKVFVCSIRSLNLTNRGTKSGLFSKFRLFFIIISIIGGKYPSKVCELRHWRFFLCQLPLNKTFDTFASADLWLTLWLIKLWLILLAFINDIGSECFFRVSNPETSVTCLLYNYFWIKYDREWCTLWEGKSIDKVWNPAQCQVFLNYEERLHFEPLAS